MKSLYGQFRELNYEKLLSINGGYSSSSGGSAGIVSSCAAGSASVLSGGCSSGYHGGSVTSGTGTSFSSANSTGGSGYSCSSGSVISAAGAAGSGITNNHYTGSGSSYSSTSSIDEIYRFNDPRFLYINGQSYMSTTGFLIPTDYEKGKKMFQLTDAPSDEVPEAQYWNQHDFAVFFGKDYAGKLCAAVSLLNEVSEQYTKKTGYKMSYLMAAICLDEAKDAGYLDNNAKVTDWAKCAESYFSTLNIKTTCTAGEGNLSGISDMVVYGVDYCDKNGTSHWVNSLGTHSYFDVQNNKTGYENMLTYHGWDVRVVGVNVKFN